MEQKLLMENLLNKWSKIDKKVRAEIQTGEIDNFIGIVTLCKIKEEKIKVISKAEGVNTSESIQTSIISIMETVDLIVEHFEKREKKGSKWGD